MRRTSLPLLMNLRDPATSYFFGFALCDGHLAPEAKKKRKAGWSMGQFKIELDSRDESILEVFAALLPCKTHLSRRERVTPVNKFPRTASRLLAWDLRLLATLNGWGFPYGSKSLIVCPPSVEYSEIDFVRGVIDADGSVGVTSLGLPFVGLTTSSEAMAAYFVDFVQRTLGGPRKVFNRNHRGVYQLVVMRQRARELARALYYEGCVALPRKLASARTISETTISVAESA